MSINRRFKEFRNKVGINQMILAENLGVTQSAISNYEKEGVPIPDYILIILKSKYNISEDWMQNGNGEMLLNNEYQIPVREQTIHEPLNIDFKMQTELEFLRQQVQDLSSTVRDQAASLRDYAAAEKDNARSRINLTDTVITQAQTIANLTGKPLKKASGSD